MQTKYVFRVLFLFLFRKWIKCNLSMEWQIFFSSNFDIIELLLPSLTTAFQSSMSISCYSSFCFVILFYKNELLAIIYWFRCIQTRRIVFPIFSLFKRALSIRRIVFRYLWFQTIFLLLHFSFGLVLVIYYICIEK